MCVYVYWILGVGERGVEVMLIALYILILSRSPPPRACTRVRIAAINCRLHKVSIPGFSENT